MMDSDEENNNNEVINYDLREQTKVTNSFISGYQSYQV